MITLPSLNRRSGTIESRYEVDSQGRCLVDISAERIGDLYHRLDRRSPYIRRDLDPELTDYVIDCARELGKRPFALRFGIEQAIDDDAQQRIVSSIHDYFGYLAERVRRDLARMLRKSLVFLLLGLVILFLAVWLSQWQARSASTAASVFTQGLTVAAWVSLWEALAIFLVEWFPQQREISLCRRLANTTVLFQRTERQAGADA